jgi:hypothetical protein
VSVNVAEMGWTYNVVDPDAASKGLRFQVRIEYYTIALRECFHLGIIALIENVKEMHISEHLHYPSQS